VKNLYKNNQVFPEQVETKTKVKKKDNKKIKQKIGKGNKKLKHKKNG
jgi:hypothetical protein